MDIKITSNTNRIFIKYKQICLIHTLLTIKNESMTSRTEIELIFLCSNRKFIIQTLSFFVILQHTCNIHIQEMISQWILYQMATLIYSFFIPRKNNVMLGNNVFYYWVVISFPLIFDSSSLHSTDVHFLTPNLSFFADYKSRISTTSLS